MSYCTAACAEAWGVSGRVCPTATLALARVSSTAACGRVCVSVQQRYSPRRCVVCRCFTWTNLFKRSLCCVRGVWPTAPCAAPVLSVYKSLCCIWTCLSTRAFVLHPDVSAYKSFVLYLDVSVYKSLFLNLCMSFYNALRCTCFQDPVTASVLLCLQELCDTPGFACLQESSPCCTYRWIIFRFVSVCFKTWSFGCFDTCFKHRSKPKQTKRNIFWFRETNRKKPKQIEFRFFSIQTENIFWMYRGQWHSTAFISRLIWEDGPYGQNLKKIWFYYNKSILHRFVWLITLSQLRNKLLIEIGGRLKPTFMNTKDFMLCIVPFPLPLK